MEDTPSPANTGRNSYLCLSLIQLFILYRHENRSAVLIQAMAGSKKTRRDRETKFWWQEQRQDQGQKIENRVRDRRTGVLYWYRQCQYQRQAYCRDKRRLEEIERQDSGDKNWDRIKDRK
jgi:hypothetical protein